MNKPCSTGRLVRWFVILLEFDFIVVVKKGSTHQRADHVSRIPNGEHLIGVSDEQLDACLFQMEMVTKWSECLVHFLTTGDTIELGETCEEKVDFMQACSNFQMIAGQLYHLCQDGVFRLVVFPDDYPKILHQAHVSSNGYHSSGELTMQRILWEGFWWPTLKEDAITYVLQCHKCKTSRPSEHCTLFHVQPIPSWADKIYQFISNPKVFESLPLHHHK